MFLKYLYTENSQIDKQCGMYAEFAQFAACLISDALLISLVHLFIVPRNLRMSTQSNYASNQDSISSQLVTSIENEKHAREEAPVPTAQDNASLPPPNGGL